MFGLGTKVFLYTGITMHETGNCSEVFFSRFIIVYSSNKIRKTQNEHLICQNGLICSLELSITFGFLSRKY